MAHLRQFVWADDTDTRCGGGGGDEDLPSDNAEQSADAGSGGSGGPGRGNCRLEEQDGQSATTLADRGYWNHRANKGQPR